MHEIIQRQIQSTRRKILVTLKKRGGMTADELSETLHITPMGVRRHLMTLEKDGLVQYVPVQRGVGRPSYVYSLTMAADDLFPKHYSQLLLEILDLLQALDGKDKIDLLFAKRMERIVAQHAGRLAGLPLEQRVAELARIMDENGSLAEWERIDDRTFLLREHNCVFAQIATRCPQVCTTELNMVRQLLQAEVTREKHMMSGDEGCCYRISLNGSST